MSRLTEQEGKGAPISTPRPCTPTIRTLEVAIFFIATYHYEMVASQVVWPTFVSEDISKGPVNFRDVA
jgi:hypothetical protein